MPIVGGTTCLAGERFHSPAHPPVRKTAIARHVTSLHNQHPFRDFSTWARVAAGDEIIDRIMGAAIARDALKSRQRIEVIRTPGMRSDDPRPVAARNRYAGRYGLGDDLTDRTARS